MSDTLDCIHGIDLLWPCFACQDLAGQMAKEWAMQTSGTFPHLYKTDSVTKPKKGASMPCKGGSKGKGKGGRTGR